MDLVLEIIGGSVVFADEGDADLTLDSIDANGTLIVEIELSDDVTEHDITVEASHLRVPDAEVVLDVHIFEGVNQRDIHIQNGDTVEVEYTVWNADTGEELDDGEWGDSAGDGCNWSIVGFCWSMVGLDIDEDRGLIPGLDTGTTHTTLLPPEIAYGNSEGHELQDAWLRFEIKVVRSTI